MITRKRSVVALILIMLMLMVCTVSVHAMYAPASSGRVTKLMNRTFTNAREGGANGLQSTPVKTTTKGMYAIKPKVAKYQYMIQPSQITKKSSRIVSGTTLKDKYMNEIANKGKRDYGKWTDANFCFNLDANGHPKVEYTGYEIYDAQKHAYVQLKIIGEVKSYSYVKDKDEYYTEGKKHKYKPIVTFGKNLHGLPQIMAVNCGNVKIKWSFYTTDGKPYNVRMSMTYNDIDCMQALSIDKASSAGFVVLPQQSLKFGDADSDYWAVSSTTKENITAAKEEMEYSMGFYVDGTSTTWIYTTNQKASGNKPDGSWSYFRPLVYKSEELIEQPPAPVKRVYDNDKSNDSVYGKHNTLTKRGDEFQYVIYQKIPPNYYAGTSSELKNLTFFDQIDDCLSVTSWQMDVLDLQKIGTDAAEKNDYTGTTGWAKLGDGTGTGKGGYVTASKSAVTNGNKWSFAINPMSIATKDVRNIIYGKGNGSVVRMVINVKISESTDKIPAKYGQDGVQHQSDQLNEGKYWVFPNTADVKYTIAAKNKTKTNSVTDGYNTVNGKNYVYTRVKKTYTRDLTFGKKTVDSYISSDKAKEFTYTLSLESGSKYDGVIKRADGKTENFTFKDTQTFKLKEGDYVTIKNLRGDVEYSIKEDGTEGFVPSYEVKTESTAVQGKTKESGSKGGSLTAKGYFDSEATDGKSVTYDFTNKFETAAVKLNVSKKVTGTTDSDTFKFHVYVRNAEPNKTITVSTGDTISVDANGNGDKVVSLKAGEGFTFTIPERAEYRIEEEKTSGYKPSYTVTEGNTSVTEKNDSAGKGEALSTPWETVKAGAEFINYQFTNDKTVTSDFIIHKTVSGTKADLNEEFSFDGWFEGIPQNADGTYPTIKGQIYFLENGQKKVVKEFQCVPRYGGKFFLDGGNGESHYDKIKLKSGWYMKLSGLPTGTQYHLDEDENDYSLTVTRTVKGSDGRVISTDTHKRNPYGTYSYKDEEHNYNEANMNGTIPADDDTTITLDYENHRDADPTTNSIVIEKTATDGTNAAFDAEVNLQGLKANTNYAVVSETGNTIYTLSSGSEGNYVSDLYVKSDTVFGKIAGVKLTVEGKNGETEEVITTQGSVGIAGYGWTKWSNNYLVSKFDEDNYTVKWAGEPAKSDGTQFTEGTFKGTITSFKSDSNGKATVKFPISNDKTARIDGLPDGASYTVTEKADEYEPSVKVYRNGKSVNKKDGKAGEALTTDRYEFDGKAEDTVHFTNKLSNSSLRVQKKTNGDASKDFDYDVNLKGLNPRKEYSVKTSGTHNYKIAMGTTGDITVSSSNGGNVGGIEVKLTRPYDGNSKTLTTDSSGKISADQFWGWLSKGQTGAFDFTIEWGGGTVNGHFGAN